MVGPLAGEGKRKPMFLEVSSVYGVVPPSRRVRFA